MSIKFLNSYMEICTVLGVIPTFEGLNRYKTYKIALSTEIELGGCLNDR
ncbi:MAG: hypothetical protein RSD36_16235 [Terrisporobacter sp.]